MEIKGDFQEKFDLGYDTDRIAEFEIDKSFTEFLLCQTCCSKFLSLPGLFVELARDPKECDYCDKLFCKLCIENWLLLNRNCPICHKDIKIRGASRVVQELINSYRIKSRFCTESVPLPEIEKHEQSCGQIVCDNPLCKKALKTQKYFKLVTNEGKINVCNDVCEQLAKFSILRSKTNI